MQAVATVATLWFALAIAARPASADPGVANCDDLATHTWRNGSHTHWRTVTGWSPWAPAALPACAPATAESDRTRTRHRNVTMRTAFVPHENYDIRAYNSAGTAAPAGAVLTVCHLPAPAQLGEPDLVAPPPEVTASALRHRRLCLLDKHMSDEQAMAHPEHGWRTALADPDTVPPGNYTLLTTSRRTLCHHATWGLAALASPDLASATGTPGTVHCKWHLQPADPATGLQWATVGPARVRVYVERERDPELRLLHGGRLFLMGSDLRLRAAEETRHVRVAIPSVAATPNQTGPPQFHSAVTLRVNASGNHPEQDQDHAHQLNLHELTPPPALRATERAETWTIVGQGRDPRSAWKLADHLRPTTLAQPPTGDAPPFAGMTCGGQPVPVSSPHRQTAPDLGWLPLHLPRALHPPAFTSTRCHVLLDLRDSLLPGEHRLTVATELLTLSVALALPVLAEIPPSARGNHRVAYVESDGWAISVAVRRLSAADGQVHVDVGLPRDMAPGGRCADLLPGEAVHLFLDDRQLTEAEREARLTETDPPPACQEPSAQARGAGVRLCHPPSADCAAPVSLVQSIALDLPFYGGLLDARVHGFRVRPDELPTLWTPMLFPTRALAADRTWSHATVGLDPSHDTTAALLAQHEWQVACRPDVADVERAGGPPLFLNHYGGVRCTAHALAAPLRDLEFVPLVQCHAADCPDTDAPHKCTDGKCYPHPDDCRRQQVAYTCAAVQPTAPTEPPALWRQEPPPPPGSATGPSAASVRLVRCAAPGRAECAADPNSSNECRRFTPSGQPGIWPVWPDQVVADDGPRLQWDCNAPEAGPAPDLFGTTCHLLGCYPPIAGTVAVFLTDVLGQPLSEQRCADACHESVPGLPAKHYGLTQLGTHTQCRCYRDMPLETQLEPATGTAGTTTMCSRSGDLEWHTHAPCPELQSVLDTADLPAEGAPQSATDLDVRLVRATDALLARVRAERLPVLMVVPDDVEGVGPTQAPDLDLLEPRMDDIHSLPGSREFAVSVAFHPEQQRNRHGQPLPFRLATSSTLFLSDRRTLEQGSRCFEHLRTDTSTGQLESIDTGVCSDASITPPHATDNACALHGSHRLLCPGSRPHMCNRPRWLSTARTTESRPLRELLFHQLRWSGQHIGTGYLQTTRVMAAAGGSTDGATGSRVLQLEVIPGSTVVSRTGHQVLRGEAVVRVYLPVDVRVALLDAAHRHSGNASQPLAACVPETATCGFQGSVGVADVEVIYMVPLRSQADTPEERAADDASRWWGTPRWSRAVPWTRVFPDENIAVGDDDDNINNPSSFRMPSGAQLERPDTPFTLALCTDSESRRETWMGFYLSDDELQDAHLAGQGLLPPAVGCRSTADAGAAVHWPVGMGVPPPSAQAPAVVQAAAMPGTPFPLTRDHVCREFAHECRDSAAPTAGTIERLLRDCAEWGPAQDSVALQVAATRSSGALDADARQLRRTPVAPGAGGGAALCLAHTDERAPWPALHIWTVSAAAAIDLGVRPEHDLPVASTVAFLLVPRITPSTPYQIFDKNSCAEGGLVLLPTPTATAPRRVQLVYSFGSCRVFDQNAYQNTRVTARQTLQLDLPLLGTAMHLALVRRGDRTGRVHALEWYKDGTLLQTDSLPAHLRVVSTPTALRFGTGDVHALLSGATPGIELADFVVFRAALSPAHLLRLADAARHLHAAGPHWSPALAALADPSEYTAIDPPTVSAFEGLFRVPLASGDWRFVELTTEPSGQVTWTNCPDDTERCSLGQRVSNTSARLAEAVGAAAHLDVHGDLWLPGTDRALRCRRVAAPVLSTCNFLDAGAGAMVCDTECGCAGQAAECPCSGHCNDTASVFRLRSPAHDQCLTLASSTAALAAPVNMAPCGGTGQASSYPSQLFRFSVYNETHAQLQSRDADEPCLGVRAMASGPVAVAFLVPDSGCAEWTTVRFLRRAVLVDADDARLAREVEFNTLQVAGDIGQLVTFAVGPDAPEASVVSAVQGTGAGEVHRPRVLATGLAPRLNQFSVPVSTDSRIRLTLGANRPEMSSAVVAVPAPGLPHGRNFLVVTRALGQIPWVPAGAWRSVPEQPPVTFGSAGHGLRITSSELLGGSAGLTVDSADDCRRRCELLAGCVAAHTRLNSAGGLTCTLGSNAHPESRFWVSARFAAVRGHSFAETVTAMRESATAPAAWAEHVTARVVDHQTGLLQPELRRLHLEPAHPRPGGIARDLTGRLVSTVCLPADYRTTGAVASGAVASAAFRVSANTLSEGPDSQLYAVHLRGMLQNETVPGYSRGAPCEGTHDWRASACPAESTVSGADQDMAVALVRGKDPVRFSSSCVASLQPNRTYAAVARGGAEGPQAGHEVLMGFVRFEVCWAAGRTYPSRLPGVPVVPGAGARVGAVVLAAPETPAEAAPSETLQVTLPWSRSMAGGADPPVMVVLAANHSRHAADMDNRDLLATASSAGAQTGWALAVPPAQTTPYSDLTYAVPSLFLSTQARDGPRQLEMWLLPAPSARPWPCAGSSPDPYRRQLLASRVWARVPFGTCEAFVYPTSPPCTGPGCWPLPASNCTRGSDPGCADPPTMARHTSVQLFGTETYEATVHVLARGLPVTDGAVLPLMEQLVVAEGIFVLALQGHTARLQRFLHTAPPTGAQDLLYEGLPGVDLRPCAASGATSCALRLTSNAELSSANSTGEVCLWQPGTTLRQCCVRAGGVTGNGAINGTNGTNGTNATNARGGQWPACHRNQPTVTPYPALAQTNVTLHPRVINMTMCGQPVLPPPVPRASLPPMPTLPIPAPGETSPLYLKVPRLSLRYGVNSTDVHTLAHGDLPLDTAAWSSAATGNVGDQSASSRRLLAQAAGAVPVTSVHGSSAGSRRLLGLTYSWMPVWLQGALKRSDLWRLGVDFWVSRRETHRDTHHFSASGTRIPYLHYFNDDPKLSWSYDGGIGHINNDYGSDLVKAAIGSCPAMYDDRYNLIAGDMSRENHHDAPFGAYLQSNIFYLNGKEIDCRTATRNSNVGYGGHESASLVFTCGLYEWGHRARQSLHSNIHHRTLRHWPSFEDFGCVATATKSPTRSPTWAPTAAPTTAPCSTTVSTHRLGGVLTVAGSGGVGTAPVRAAPYNLAAVAAAGEPYYCDPEAHCEADPHNPSVARWRGSLSGVPPQCYARHCATSDVNVTGTQTLGVQPGFPQHTPAGSTLDFGAHGTEMYIAGHKYQCFGTLLCSNPVRLDLMGATSKIARVDDDAILWGPTATASAFEAQRNFAWDGDTVSHLHSVPLPDVPSWSVPQWWEVDLGANYHVLSVELQARTNPAVGLQSNGLRISVGSVTCVAETSGYVPHGNAIEWPCDLVGSTVRVSNIVGVFNLNGASAQYILSFAELQVNVHQPAGLGIPSLKDSEWLDQPTCYLQSCGDPSMRIATSPAATQLGHPALVATCPKIISVVGDECLPELTDNNLGARLTCEPLVCTAAPGLRGDAQWRSPTATNASAPPGSRCFLRDCEAMVPHRSLPHDATGGAPGRCDPLYPPTDPANATCVPLAFTGSDCGGTNSSQTCRVDTATADGESYRCPELRCELPTVFATMPSTPTAAVAVPIGDADWVSLAGDPRTGWAPKLRCYHPSLSVCPPLLLHTLNRTAAGVETEIAVDTSPQSPRLADCTQCYEACVDEAPNATCVDRLHQGGFDQSSDPDWYSNRRQCRRTYDGCADTAYGPPTLLRDGASHPDCQRNRHGDVCDPRIRQHYCPRVECEFDDLVGRATWRRLQSLGGQPDVHTCGLTPPPTPAPTVGYALGPADHSSRNMTEPGFRCSSDPFVYTPPLGHPQCRGRDGDGRGSFCHPTAAALTGTAEMRRWEACPLDGCGEGQACQYDRHKQTGSVLPELPGLTGYTDHDGRHTELMAWRDWYAGLEPKRCSCQPHEFAHDALWHAKPTPQWPHCDAGGAESAEQCSYAGRRLVRAGYGGLPVDAPVAESIEVAAVGVSAPAGAEGCSVRVDMVRVRERDACIEHTLPVHFNREVIDKFTGMPDAETCKRACAGTVGCQFWMWTETAQDLGAYSRSLFGSSGLNETTRVVTEAGECRLLTFVNRRAVVGVGRVVAGPGECQVSVAKPSCQAVGALPEHGTALSAPACLAACRGATECTAVELAYGAGLGDQLPVCHLYGSDCAAVADTYAVRPGTELYVRGLQPMFVEAGGLSGALARLASGGNSTHEERRLAGVSTTDDQADNGFELVCQGEKPPYFPLDAGELMSSVARYAESCPSGYSEIASRRSCAEASSFLGLPGRTYHAYRNRHCVLPHSRLATRLIGVPSTDMVHRSECALRCAQHWQCKAFVWVPPKAGGGQAGVGGLTGDELAALPGAEEHELPWHVETGTTGPRVKTECLPLDEFALFAARPADNEELCAARCASTTGCELFVLGPAPGYSCRLFAAACEETDPGAGQQARGQRLVRHTGTPAPSLCALYRGCEYFAATSPVGGGGFTAPNQTFADLHLAEPVGVIVAHSLVRTALEVHPVTVPEWKDLPPGCSLVFEDGTRAVPRLRFNEVRNRLTWAAGTLAEPNPHPHERPEGRGGAGAARLRLVGGSHADDPSRGPVYRRLCGGNTEATYPDTAERELGSTWRTLAYGAHGSSSDPQLAHREHEVWQYANSTAAGSVLRFAMGAEHGMDCRELPGYEAVHTPQLCALGTAAFGRAVRREPLALSSRDFEGETWYLVRRAAAGGWHTATDDLAGVDVYGDYSWDPTASHSFSIGFGGGYTRVLLATGDMSAWLVLARAGGCLGGNSTRLVSEECAASGALLPEERLQACQSRWYPRYNESRGAPAGGAPAMQCRVDFADAEGEHLVVATDPLVTLSAAAVATGTAASPGETLYMEAGASDPRFPPPATGANVWVNARPSDGFLADRPGSVPGCSVDQPLGVSRREAATHGAYWWVAGAAAGSAQLGDGKGNLNTRRLESASPGAPFPVHTGVTRALLDRGDAWFRGAPICVGTEARADLWRRVSGPPSNSDAATQPPPEFLMSTEEGWGCPTEHGWYAVVSSAQCVEFHNALQASNLEGTLPGGPTRKLQTEYIPSRALVRLLGTADTVSLTALHAGCSVLPRNLTLGSEDTGEYFWDNREGQHAHRSGWDWQGRRVVYNPASPVEFADELRPPRRVEAEALAPGSYARGYAVCTRMPWAALASDTWYTQGVALEEARGVVPVRKQTGRRLRREFSVDLRFGVATAGDRASVRAEVATFAGQVLAAGVPRGRAVLRSVEWTAPEDSVEQLRLTVVADYDETSLAGGLLLSALSARDSQGLLARMGRASEESVRDFAAGVEGEVTAELTTEATATGDVWRAEAELDVSAKAEVPAIDKMLWAEAVCACAGADCESGVDLVPVLRTGALSAGHPWSTPPALYGVHPGQRRLGPGGRAECLTACAGSPGCAGVLVSDAAGAMVTPSGDRVDCVHLANFESLGELPVADPLGAVAVHVKHGRCGAVRLRDTRVCRTPRGDGAETECPTVESSELERAGSVELWPVTGGATDPGQCWAHTGEEHAVLCSDGVYVNMTGGVPDPVDTPECVHRGPIGRVRLARCPPLFPYMCRERHLRASDYHCAATATECADYGGARGCAWFEHDLGTLSAFDRVSYNASARSDLAVLARTRVSEVAIDSVSRCGGEWVQSSTATWAVPSPEVCPSGFACCDPVGAASAPFGLAAANTSNVSGLAIGCECPALALEPDLAVHGGAFADTCFSPASEWPGCRQECLDRGAECLYYMRHESGECLLCHSVGAVAEAGAGVAGWTHHAVRVPAVTTRERASLNGLSVAEYLRDPVTRVTVAPSARVEGQWYTVAGDDGCPVGYAALTAASVGGDVSAREMCAAALDLLWPEEVDLHGGTERYGDADDGCNCDYPDGCAVLGEALAWQRAGVPRLGGYQASSCGCGRGALPVSLRPRMLCVQRPDVGIYHESTWQHCSLECTAAVDCTHWAWHDEEGRCVLLSAARLPSWQAGVSAMAPAPFGVGWVSGRRQVDPVEQHEHQVRVLRARVLRGGCDRACLERLHADTARAVQIVAFSRMNLARYSLPMATGSRHYDAASVAMAAVPTVPGVRPTDSLVGLAVFPGTSRGLATTVEVSGRCSGLDNRTTAGAGADAAWHAEGVPSPQGLAEASGVSLWVYLHGDQAPGTTAVLARHPVHALEEGGPSVLATTVGASNGVRLTVVWGLGATHLPHAERTAVWCALETSLAGRRWTHLGLWLQAVRGTATDGGLALVVLVVDGQECERRWVPVRPVHPAGGTAVDDDRSEWRALATVPDPTRGGGAGLTRPLDGAAPRLARAHVAGLRRELGCSEPGCAEGLAWAAIASGGSDPCTHGLFVNNASSAVLVQPARGVRVGLVGTDGHWFPSAEEDAQAAALQWRTGDCEGEGLVTGAEYSMEAVYDVSLRSSEAFEPAVRAGAFVPRWLGVAETRSGVYEERELRLHEGASLETDAPVWRAESHYDRTWLRHVADGDRTRMIRATLEPDDSSPFPGVYTMHTDDSYGISRTDHIRVHGTLASGERLACAECLWCYGACTLVAGESVALVQGLATDGQPAGGWTDRALSPVGTVGVAPLGDGQGAEQHVLYAADCPSGRLTVVSQRSGRCLAHDGERTRYAHCDEVAASTRCWEMARGTMWISGTQTTTVSFDDSGRTPHNGLSMVWKSQADLFLAPVTLTDLHFAVRSSSDRAAAESYRALGRSARLYTADGHSLWMGRCTASVSSQLVPCEDECRHGPGGVATLPRCAVGAGARVQCEPGCTMQLGVRGGNTADAVDLWLQPGLEGYRLRQRDWLHDRNTEAVSEGRCLGPAPGGVLGATLVLRACKAVGISEYRLHRAPGTTRHTVELVGQPGHCLGRLSASEGVWARAGVVSCDAAASELVHMVYAQHDDGDVGMGPAAALQRGADPHPEQLFRYTDGTASITGYLHRQEAGGTVRVAVTADAQDGAPPALVASLLDLAGGLHLSEGTHYYRVRVRHGRQGAMTLLLARNGTVVDQYELQVASWPARKWPVRRTSRSPHGLRATTATVSGVTLRSGGSADWVPLQAVSDAEQRFASGVRWRVYRRDKTWSVEDQAACAALCEAEVAAGRECAAARWTAATKRCEVLPQCTSPGRVCEGVPNTANLRPSPCRLYERTRVRMSTEGAPYVLWEQRERVPWGGQADGATLSGGLVAEAIVAAGADADATAMRLASVPGLTLWPNASGLFAPGGSTGSSSGSARRLLSGRLWDPEAPSTPTADTAVDLDGSPVGHGGSEAPESEGPGGYPPVLGRAVGASAELLCPGGDVFAFAGVLNTAKARYGYRAVLSGGSEAGTGGVSLMLTPDGALVDRRANVAVGSRGNEGCVSVVVVECGRGGLRVSVNGRVEHALPECPFDVNSTDTRMRGWTGRREALCLRAEGALLSDARHAELVSYLQWAHADSGGSLCADIAETRFAEVPARRLFRALGEGARDEQVRTAGHTWRVQLPTSGYATYLRCGDADGVCASGSTYQMYKTAASPEGGANPFGIAVAQSADVDEALHVEGVGSWQSNVSLATEERRCGIAGMSAVSDCGLDCAQEVPCSCEDTGFTPWEQLHPGPGEPAHPSNCGECEEVLESFSHPLQTATMKFARHTGRRLRLDQRYSLNYTTIWRRERIPELGGCPAYWADPERFLLRRVESDCPPCPRDCQFDAMAREQVTGAWPVWAGAAAGCPSGRPACATVDSAACGFARRVMQTPNDHPDARGCEAVHLDDMRQIAATDPLQRFVSANASGVTGTTGRGVYFEGNESGHSYLHDSGTLHFVLEQRPLFRHEAWYWVSLEQRGRLGVSTAGGCSLPCPANDCDGLEVLPRHVPLGYEAEAPLSDTLVYVAVAACLSALTLGIAAAVLTVRARSASTAYTAVKGADSAGLQL